MKLISFVTNVYTRMYCQEANEDKDKKEVSLIDDDNEDEDDEEGDF